MKKTYKTILSVILIICISNIFPYINMDHLYAANKKNIWDIIREASISETYEESFKQSTFHPSASDYFGNGMNAIPIYQVYIAPNDMERKNKLCLTFDSAYINDYTYKILDILDAYNAKCTFFMTAEWAAANPTHVQEIARRGHEIGNHTVTHPNLNYYNESSAMQEILGCHALIKSLIGEDMCLFRYPYGSYTMRTLDTVKALGYYPIQWTFDSVDWKNESKNIEIRRFRYSDRIVPGSIILCHNGATYTPECLPEILEYLKSKNIQCVKVSDLIYKHDFYMRDGVQTPYLDSYGNRIGNDNERP